MNTEANDCFHQQDGERLSRVEYAYRKIKTNISQNNYPAGFQILEPDLAKALGVSRTPVREALIRLEADNLIQLVPRRGMKVLPISHQDINELIEALKSLEVGAANVVNSTLNTTTPQVLENKIRLLHQAAQNKDKLAWIEADECFHIEFVKLMGNSRVEKLFRGLLSQLHRAKYLAFDLSPVWDEFSASNSELILALKQNRKDGAVSAIERYHNALSEIFAIAKERHKRVEF